MTELALVAASELDALAIEIRTHHENALAAHKTSVEEAALCGEKLATVKSRLGHGAWLPWLEANVEFTRRTASNYMRLAQAMANGKQISHLGVAEALADLAEPREESPFVAEFVLTDFEREQIETRADSFRTPASEEIDGEVVAIRAEVLPPPTDKMAVHFSSATDEWATPQDFFDVLHDEFDFDLDVCALPSSAKCAKYFGPEDDGLSQTWEGVCWMNPPYGTEIGQWVRKAYESSLAGATVVCLVPARTDTAWWWDYAPYAEIRLVRGRLKFGGVETSAPFPNALVIFGRKPNVSKSFWWEWR